MTVEPTEPGMQEYPFRIEEDRIILDREAAKDSRVYRREREVAAEKKLGIWIPPDPRWL